MSTTLELGNAAPITISGDVREVQPWMGQQITTVHFPDGALQEEFSELATQTPNDRVVNRIKRNLTPQEQGYVLAIADIESLWWGTHSDAPPAWVESEDTAFATAVARHFTKDTGHDVPVGRPSGWEPTTVVYPPAGGSPELDTLMDRMGLDVGDVFGAHYRDEALLTNAGRDGLHAQHLTTGAQPAAFNYMGVSANATAPSASNTTLPGEITTAGGGLLRAQATYAHTTGTNTSTLTRTFTANGSDSLPVTLAKIGILNAASVGTLGYETLLSATSTLTVSGDNVTITETVTAG